MFKFIINKWKLIILGVFLVTLALGTGAFASFYGKSVKSEALLGALNYIESGAIPNPSEVFKARTETLKESPNSKVNPGAYKNVSFHNGVVYDTAIVLKNDGSYNFAMTVGNGTVHKTYQHEGRWWVEGEVFHTILMAGDLFLASPESRDKMTPMKEIIVSSSDDELALLAHYSEEPVVFSLEK